MSNATGTSPSQSPDDGSDASEITDTLPARDAGMIHSDRACKLRAGHLVKDLSPNILGLALVAVLNGDEVGFPEAKLAEITRHR